MDIKISTCDPNTGYRTCIQSSGNSSWIMWVAEDGSGIIYTERDESGAVIGPPVELMPRRATND